MIASIHRDQRKLGWRDRHVSIWPRRDLVLRIVGARCDPGPIAEPGIVIGDLGLPVIDGVSRMFAPRAIQLQEAIHQMIPPSRARASASRVLSISMRSAKMAHHPPPNSFTRGLEQLSAHSKPIGAFVRVSRQHRWMSWAKGSGWKSVSLKKHIVQTSGASRLLPPSKSTPKLGKFGSLKIARRPLEQSAGSVGGKMARNSGVGSDGS